MVRGCEFTAGLGGAAMWSVAARAQQFGGVLRLLLLAALACVTQTALADDDPVAGAVQDICQSGQAEGGYQGMLSPDLALAQLYIICVGTSSIYATASVKGSGSYMSMVHIAVDGDRISFLSYDPSNDGSKTSPGRMPSPEFRVSIEALIRGEMVGTYRTLRLAPQVISLKKSMTFPNVMALADSSRSYSKVPGHYILENPERLRGAVVPPAYVTVEIIGGIQRITLSGANNGIALLNGLKATDLDNSKDVFAATSGIDDGAYGKSTLSHLRGHMLNNDEIEFYYINTKTGVVGPFRAKRDAGGDLILSATPPLAPSHTRRQTSKP